jgi:glycosyltransferase involved in cell wall biosynthesis
MLASVLYRFAMSYKNLRVIFQNPDDQTYFVENNLVDRSKTVLIRGSGVNVEKFQHLPLPNNEMPVVLFAGRLLWSKGIRELIEATKKLKSRMSFKLVLVGEPDEQNPECVPRRYLEELQSEGTIEWLGRQSDMPRLYQSADIVCLPTLYKEGLPLSLLEAASCGRPLIATDVPGCREIVRNGQNGYLVAPYKIDELALALEKLLQSKELRENFGNASAQMARAEFSAQIVQAQLVKLYESFPQ